MYEIPTEFEFGFDLYYEHDLDQWCAQAVWGRIGHDKECRYWNHSNPEVVLRLAMVFLAARLALVMGKPAPTTVPRKERSSKQHRMF